MFDRTARQQIDLAPEDTFDFLVEVKEVPIRCTPGWNVTISSSQTLNKKYDLEVSPGFLPSMLGVPCWEFDTCLEMLRASSDALTLVDDLDPEAEHQLCERARRE